MKILLVTWYYPPANTIAAVRLAALPRTLSDEGWDALVFPGSREPMLRAAGYTFPGFPALNARRSQFEAEGILQTARLGQSETGLLAVKRFFDAIVPEMKSLVDRYRPHYDLDSRYWEKLEYF